MVEGIAYAIVTRTTGQRANGSRRMIVVKSSSLRGGKDAKGRVTMRESNG